MKFKIGKGGFNPIKKSSSGKLSLNVPKIKVNLKPILKAAGSVTGSISGLVKKGGKLIEKIPIAGKPLKAAYDWTYGNKIALIDNIAHGERIDKAVYGNFKKKIKDAQTLAPYVQSVVSTVPAVGQGLSGAIGAANALSKGQPIDEAIYEGVKDSVPGGPAARAAVDIGYNLAKGNPVDEAVINALPIGEAEKQAVLTGFKTVSGIAKGEKVSDVLIDQAFDMLPSKEIKDAMQTGLALGVGQDIQKIATEAIPEAMPKFQDDGYQIVKTNEFFRVGFENLKKNNKAEQKGYLKAIGLMSYKSTPVAMASAFESIPESQKAGFEIGIGVATGSYRVGMKNKNIKKSFGYALAKGLKGSGRKKKDDAPIFETREPTKGEELEYLAEQLIAQMDPMQPVTMAMAKAAVQQLEAYRKTPEYEAELAALNSPIKARKEKKFKIPSVPSSVPIPGLDQFDPALREKKKKKKNHKKKPTRSDELLSVMAKDDSEVGKGIKEAEEPWWTEYLGWIIGL